MTKEWQRERPPEGVPRGRGKIGSGEYSLSQGVLEKNSRRVESYNKDAPSHIAMLKRRMVVASLIAPARSLIMRMS